MNRYINSFFITVFIYILIFSSFYFLFFKNIEKKEHIKNSKTISLSHIKLETNKKEFANKVLKKEKIVKKKSANKVVKKKKIIKKAEELKKPKRKIKNEKKEVKNFVKKESIKKSKELTHSKKIDKQVSIKSKKDIKKEYLDKYLHLIKEEIQKNVIYSKRAKRFNIQGIVTVKFKITVDKEVKIINIVKGHRLLQKSTISAIKKASKNFPKVPKSLILTLPIEYRLI